MSEVLRGAIYQGEIKKAIEYATQINIEELEELLMDWSFEEPSIIIYTFLNKYLKNYEDARLHSLAADILCHPLCHMEGAYLAAFYHARQCIELEPNNMQYREFLLFFAGIPERIFEGKVAIKWAMDILQDEPNNEVAKNYIEENL
ncbi:hypothetical protein HWX41_25295 [Bacillus paramycoides]|uniref:hypothetical protein n=1 Tax=Bacillus paramycoides TaxID=2026194 RepID=UPI0015C064BF|nr:hypothetical protein [Bacillus paramycoides]NWK72276.1 hypothetical protein [Bacillus paramycoides]